MICCACAWCHASTLRANGLVQAGQWFCRRWYTWYDGQPGINRKTGRGFSGVWILEIWVSFTIAVCALLLDVRELVRGMFCKCHRWFEKLSVLSLGEAGHWMFRDFKNPLYRSFGASFLSVQPYLMSAMITPEFVVLINDVFSCFFFPCYLHDGQVRISVGIPCVGVLHTLHASLFFLGNCSTASVAVWACA